MIRYDHYTDKFVKVSDRECPWCKAVCASTDKYCHECGWHIADTPQTDLLVKTPRKSRESHEEKCETCRDKNAYDEWQGNCDECENGSMYTPQTDKIKKRIDKPFRAVWLDDELNEIGAPQTEKTCDSCGTKTKMCYFCDTGHNMWTPQTDERSDQ